MLFQELVCKENQQKSPQRFLYLIIRLEQKILFRSKQAYAAIRYKPKTIQIRQQHTVQRSKGVHQCSCERMDCKVSSKLRLLLSMGHVSQVFFTFVSQNNHSGKTYEHCLSPSFLLLL